jgi:hypothetical protein
VSRMLIWRKLTQMAQLCGYHIDMMQCHQRISRYEAGMAAVFLMLISFRRPPIFLHPWMLEQTGSIGNGNLRENYWSDIKALRMHSKRDHPGRRDRNDFGSISSVVVSFWKTTKTLLSFLSVVTNYLRNC